MQARRAFARELNITEFELYQTLEAEGWTKAANVYAATTAQTIYGEIKLRSHPSHFSVGQYRFWQERVRGHDAILDFFRRFPSATYGKWPHGTIIFSPYAPPVEHDIYKREFVMSRPPRALIGQVLLAGVFSKSTGGAKPLEGHEQSDLGTETDGNETKASALVSGGVGLIRPAAEMANQFLTAPDRITVYFWATKHQAGYYSSAGNRLTKNFLHQWAGIPLRYLK